MGRLSADHAGRSRRADASAHLSRKTHIHDKISPEPAESLAVGDGLLLEVNSG
jgi:hypothetical protein